jgi:hypothetical protein
MLDRKTLNIGFFRGQFNLVVAKQAKPCGSYRNPY